MQDPAVEAQALTKGSIKFAREIDFATAGRRLGAIVERLMREQPAVFDQSRAAVKSRLDELGGVGEELGLFVLAVDLATTARFEYGLSEPDRQELRRLWDDLRSR